MKNEWINRTWVQTGRQGELPSFDDGDYLPEGDVHADGVGLVQDVQSFVVDGDDDAGQRHPRPHHLGGVVETREEQKPLVFGQAHRVLLQRHQPRSRDKEIFLNDLLYLEVRKKGKED